MKKKIKFIFAIMVIMLILLFTHESIYKQKINSLIYQIKETSFGNSSVDYDMLSKVNEKINKKVNNGQEITFEEYYLVAFEDYKEFNNEKAVEEFKVALSNMKKTSNSFAKLSTGFFINNISDEYISEEGKLDIANKIFDNLTVKDWNQEIDSAISYIRTIETLKNGNDFAKDTLEKILTYESRLKDTTVLNIKSNLSVIYVTRGNYAKALEKSLEIIAKSEECGDDYFKAKAFADMGSVYLLLEDYDNAESLLKKSIDVDVKDQLKNAFVKSYVFINLYDVYFRTGNYDEIDSIREMIAENSKYLDEKNILEFAIDNNILELNYSIEKNDMEAAAEYLKKTEEAISEFKEKTNTIVDAESVVGSDVYYSMARGNFYWKSGELDTALECFKKSLDFSYDDVLYKKMILKSIIDIYYEKGLIDQAYEYTQNLENVYEDEARLINKDYSDYSLEKYSYEVQMMENNRQKIKNYIFLIIGISIVIMIFICLYIKNRNLININRTDALTKAYNRSYFNEQYEVLKDSEKNFYVLMFDIDNFKIVNDTYGHLVGDKVLKVVVSVAKKAMNGIGDLYRYGGEEFVVIAEGVSEISAFKLAENIRKSIEAIKWDEGMKITISMGAAERVCEEEDPLAVADNRLYVSKTSGKNKVTWKTA